MAYRVSRENVFKMFLKRSSCYLDCDKLNDKLNATLQKKNNVILKEKYD